MEPLSYIGSVTDQNIVPMSMKSTGVYFCAAPLAFVLRNDH